MSASRRDLQFDQLEDIKSETERLLSAGCASSGNWNLAQTCSHLENWMRFPMDGFPTPPFFVRIMLGVMRHTIGPRMRRKILAERSMQAGAPTDPATVPATDALSDEEAVQRLNTTLERFATYNGPLHTSPFFGKMSREEVHQLQLIHCAHHLGFLVPKSDSA